MIGPKSIALIALACLLLIGGGAIAYYRHANDALKAKVEAATAQAANNAEAVKQVDHYEHTTTIIREKADAGVQAIQSAPGAETILPDGVRDQWLSSIQRMRDGGPAASDIPS